jgi:hypothetical protein
VGSSHKPDVSELDNSVGNQVAPWPERLFKSMPAVSHDLFCRDLAGGDPAGQGHAWRWADGLVMDTTLTFTRDTVFFVGSDNAYARHHDSGAMEIEQFLATDDAGGPALVALDLQTGRERWRRPLEQKLDLKWLVYVAESGGKLLVTRTGYKNVGQERYQGYDFTCLDAATGEMIWTKWVQAEQAGDYTPLKYAKNSMSARPVIVGDRFYLFADMLGKKIRNYATPFSMATGERVGETVYAGNHDKGCSVAIASDDAFFYRDFMHACLPLDGDDIRKLTGATRPSCWPNTLPVGGLILAPEGSAFCSCGFPYQASFALAPLPGGGPPEEPVAE